MSAESKQIEKFKNTARDLDCNESEVEFNAALKRVATHNPGGDPPLAQKAPKVCPECQHTFQGNGWDGIDAHWKAKHDHIMTYAEAWPLVRDGKYKPAK